LIAGGYCVIDASVLLVMRAAFALRAQLPWFVSTATPAPQAQEA
jgi:hypothetical protein